MEEPNKPRVSISSIVVSAVLAAVVFGGGVYAYQSNKAKKEQEVLKNQITTLEEQKAGLEEQISSPIATTLPSSTTKADETNSWKTYSDGLFGFKYPANWGTYREDKQNHSVGVASTETINGINRYTSQKHTEAETTSYLLSQNLVQFSIGDMSCLGTDANSQCIKANSLVDYLRNFTGVPAFNSAQVTDFTSSGGVAGKIYDGKRIGNQDFNEMVIVFQIPNSQKVVNIVSTYLTPEITASEDQILQQIGKTLTF